MPTAIRSVCVYCASSEAVAPAYRAVAAGLGRALAEEGWDLVYGGGNIGLMGEVARAAMAAGAHVTGVIPHRLADREVALHTVPELLRTETMRERKALMDERSDAFVVLPGGIGTLEELVEILTLKQLGYHQRAVIVLDAEGFWDPLIAQLRRMVEQGFAQSDLLELWTITGSVEETVRALHAYVPPSPRPVPAPTLEAVESPRSLR